MKVKELIEKLKEYDQEIEVKVWSRVRFAGEFLHDFEVYESGISGDMEIDLDQEGEEGFEDLERVVVFK